MGYPTTNLVDHWAASTLSDGSNATWTGTNGGVITLTSVTSSVINGRRVARFTGSASGAFPAGQAWNTRANSFYILHRMGTSGLITYVGSGPSLYGGAIAGATYTPDAEVYASGYNTTGVPVGHERGLLGFRASASALKIQAGPRETNKSALSANSSTGGTLFYNNVPQTTSSGSAPCDLYHVFAYSAALSDSDLAALQAQAAADGFHATSLRWHIIFDGDSRTSGYLLSSPITDGYWPELAASLMSESMWYSGVAVAGQRLSTCITNLSGNVTHSLDSTYTKNAVCIFAGVNDVVSDGKTAAQVYASLVSYSQTVKAAGANTVILCIDYAMGLTSGEKTAMQSLIALLLANTSDFDIKVRFDQITGLNDWNSFNSTYYQTDNVHLKAAGQVLLAQKFYDTIYPTFAITGGTSTATVGVATDNFTLTMTSPATSGDTVTITVAGGSGNGAIHVNSDADVASITANDTDSVTVQLVASGTSFTFTFTGASAGTKTISYTNAQGWTNPGNSSVLCSARSGKSVQRIGVGVGVGV